MRWCCGESEGARPISDGGSGLVTQKTGSMTPYTAVFHSPRSQECLVVWLADHIRLVMPCSGVWEYLHYKIQYLQHIFFLILVFFLFSCFFLGFSVLYFFFIFLLHLLLLCLCHITYTIVIYTIYRHSRTVLFFLLFFLFFI